MSQDLENNHMENNSQEDDIEVGEEDARKQAPINVDKE